MAILTLYVLAFTVLTVLAVRRRDLLAVTAGVAGLLGSLWGRRLLWRDRRRDAGGDE
jgi:succinate-acetate transporter protein